MVDRRHRGRGAVRPAGVAAGEWAAGGEGLDAGLDKKLHRTIAAVGEAIDGLQFNKAVAQLYELVNAIEKAGAVGQPRPRRCARWSG